MSNPKNKVEIRWSPDFAYAIGLLTTDGNLSPDRRHINFTSKDIELVDILKTCLGISNKVGRKAREKSKFKRYYVIQFGDVNFYKFLVQLGLSPAKSKTLSDLNIPNKYFLDFLRGHFDGDGTFYSYWDPRWRSSFMFYTEFLSASKKHIEWLRKKMSQLLEIKGHVTKDIRKITYQLKYAKTESLKLLPKMYYNTQIPHLSRKYLKIKRALGIIGKQNIL